MKIRFVTTNAGKLKEAQARLGPLGFDVVPYRAHILERQADDLEAVARHKAEQLLHRAPAPYFLEDAGLFIDALDGFPGVYSHYAFQTLGNAGILKQLRGTPHKGRTATFRAVIAYVSPQERLRLVRGECHGHITDRPLGQHGFGFDPIFQPDGHGETFAQLASHAKGQVSHRGRALDALVRLIGPDANKKV